MKKTKTIVIGHRHPDTDSCAAAVAYTALKTAMGETNVIAASAGYANPRTEYLFKKFNVPLPRIIEDVSPRVKDVMNESPTVVYMGQTLLDAMEFLKESKMSRIPVTDNNGGFIGMISLFDIAERMFQKARNTGKDEDEGGIIGRGVRTSLSLAAKSLNGRISSMACNPDEITDHNVYVGAMSIQRLEAEIFHEDNSNLAIVVGDRANIHEALVKHKVRLIIVTGNAGINLDLIRRAKENGTSILQTPFDSASTVRRLKFSQPVELMLQKEVTIFHPKDKISDIYRKVVSNIADNYPVCDEKNHIIGVLTKFHVDKEPPVRLILVDHNELDQAVRGAEEVPVIEIMDHHKIGITPTDRPITVINDVVGSTSTLVCEQFRRFGKEIPEDIAGILLGGITTDTLFMRSPTSTERDSEAIRHLEKVSGTDGRKLLDEIFNVGSVIANTAPEDVIRLDMKKYTANRISFTVSQVEEAGFEHFEKSFKMLSEALDAHLQKEKLDFAALLITDIVMEDSLLLVAGAQKIINSLPFPEEKKQLYKVPDILSRKKQLLPLILKAFENI